VVGLNNEIYLIPSLDLDILPIPLNVNAEGSATLRGKMTSSALRIDIAFFLLQSALTALPAGNCIAPPDILALVAIRASGVLATDIGLALKGHIPDKHEAEQMVIDFYNKAQQVAQDLANNCIAEVLKAVLGKPAVIVLIAAQFEGKFAVWFIDNWQYHNQSVDATLAYVPPPKPSVPTDTPKPQPAPPPTTASNTATTVLVNANQDWQNTAIPVTSGDRVDITYISGMWTFDRNIAKTDARGKPGFTNAEAPVPNANLGALVAKIGSSSPFLVGLHVSTIAREAGTIYLRINDTADISDNEGSIQVEIKVQHS